LVAANPQQTGRVRCSAARRRQLCTSVIALSSVFSAFSAVAQPSAEERAVAADLFKQAAAAQGQAAWAHCEELLTEAVAIAETPGLRFHLAYCKEQQQRWVEALVDYKRAGELISLGSQAVDVAELLPQAVERLEQQIPRLTLLLEPPPQDAILYLDGVQRSTRLIGKTIPLDPGKHRVEVVAQGFDVFSHELALLPEERRELAVVLVAAAKNSQAPLAPLPAKPTRARNSEAATGLSPLTYVLISEGVISVASLSVGVVFSLRAQQYEEERQRLANDIGETSACQQGAADERCRALGRNADDADDSRTIATAAYIGGAVGASALLMTWLLWPSADPHDDAVAFAVLKTPGGVQASTLLRF
jgi:hypothetical protein